MFGGQQRSVRGGRISRRRTQAIGATIAASALMAAGLTPAAAAEADDSEAFAQVLAADLLTQDVVDANSALTGWPSDPGPDSVPFDVSLLDALTVDLGGAVEIPLISQPDGTGLLSLGEAGALSSYASSPSGASSTATAGVVGADGALDVDAGDEPGEYDYARVNLTDLLAQAGADAVTDGVVDYLGLETGALGATATATGLADGTVDTDSSYAIAGARLRLSSPLVGDLVDGEDGTGGITAAVGTVGPLLDTAVGPNGVLGTAIGTLPDLELAGIAQVNLSGGTIELDGVDEALDTALENVVQTPLEDEAGIVSVDLADGTVYVDLEQISYAEDESGQAITGLNGLPANTPLLNEATIGTITAGISEALGTLSERVVSEVVSALSDVAVTIELPAELVVLTASSDIDITVETTLGYLLGEEDAEDPEIAVEGDVLGLDVGTLLTALAAPLGTALLDTVGAALGTLTTTIGSELTPTIDDLTGAVLTALGPVLDALDAVANVVVNEQLTGTDGLLSRGAVADSFTVNALSLNLLPGILPAASAVNLDIASASVRATAYAPEITAADPVEPGDDLPVAGTGWPQQTDVTLTLTDGGNTVIGTPVVVRTDADGDFPADAVYAIPAGTAIGDYTLTAAAGTYTATDTVTVVIFDPVLTTTDPAYAGTDLPVTSTGWPPRTDVTVGLENADGPVLGDDGDPVAIVVTTDGTGAFPADTTFPLPAGLEPGDYLLVGTDEDGHTAEDGFAVYAPGLTADSPTQPGAQLPVTGTGFPPDTALEITLDDADGNPLTDADGNPIVVDVVTDGEGGFETTYPVPADAEAGSYEVVATDPATGNEASAPVEVVVYDPTVAADDPVEPGAQLPVTGAGWPPAADVTLTLTDADGDPVVDADGDPVTVVVTTDGDGGFTTTVPIPAGLADGDYVLSATDGLNEATDTVTVVDYVPTLDVPVDFVYTGSDVPVTSTGWRPNSEVSLALQTADGTPVFNDAGERITVTVQTDAQGAIPAGTTVPLPADSAAGDYVIVGADEAGNTAEDGFTAYAASVDAASPALPGDEVEVTGEGFPPGAALEVTLEDADGNPVLDADGDPVVVPATAGGDGSFSVDYPLPAGIPEGAYTVVVTDTATGDEFDAPLTVTAPALTPDGPAYAGTDEPVTGDGWPPLTEVTVTLEDADGNPVLDADGDPVSVTVTTDEDGAFETVVPVPAGLDPGDYTLVAEDEDGHTATAPLDVYAPVIEADGPVAPGEDLPITGGGFPPSTEVEIVVVDPDTGDPIGDPITVVTDEDGGIPDGTVYPIPGDTPRGDYTVVVTEPGDDQPIAQAPVTVEAGGGAPSPSPTPTETGAPTPTPTPTATPDGPTITIDDPVAPGTDAPIAGGGWTPNTPIDVVIVDGDGNPVGDPVTIVTDGDGNIPGGSVLPVPDLPDGDYTVVATDGAGNRAEDTLTVDEPIWVDLEHDVRWFAQSQEQIAYGHGFLPGERVTGTMFSAPLPLGTQIADENGDVVFTWTLLDTHEIGMHEVELTGDTSGTGTEVFRIIAAPGGTLSATGFDGGVAIPIAVILISLGAVLVLASRRRGLPTSVD